MPARKRVRVSPRIDLSMDIVVVGGPHSGVGKTLACERALQALSDRAFGAIKLTVADGEFGDGHDHGSGALASADAAGICGRGASCGVCETVSSAVPSRLVTARSAIGKVGTDTARLANAGAVAVAWVITLRSAAPAAVERAIEYLRCEGARNVLIEGTTALEWMQPSASVMVITEPGRTWKRVALTHIGRCDIVLRNHVPVPPGDVTAPVEAGAVQPIDCDLSNAADPGTLAYQRRLTRRFALLGIARSGSALG